MAALYYAGPILTRSGFEGAELLQEVRFGGLGDNWPTKESEQTPKIRARIGFS